MKTILLTGGTGFLGSHLLGFLVNHINENRMDYNVLVLKRSFSDLSRIKLYFEEPLVSFVDIDKIEDLNFIFNQYKIDVIIHTATEYGRKGTCPSSVLESNLIFPIKLFETGCKYGLKLFINTDTYFNKPNQTYKNMLDYSLSKKTLNLWLEYLSANCKVVNLRLEHLYGAYDKESKFCEHIFQSVVVRQDKILELTGGEQKRDFVFVDDVCIAYITVLENYTKYFFNFLTFDVGTGTPVSIRQFVEYVKECSCSNTKLAFGKLPYREDEIMTSRADTTTLLNWGFKAETSYKQGIEKIVNLYKKAIGETYF